MKKLIVLTLLIFLTVGCTSKLTNQEFKNFNSDYNDLYEATSEKILDRSYDVVSYSENKRENEEINILLNKLGEMISDTEGSVPSEHSEQFNEIQTSYENLVELEEQNTSSSINEVKITKAEEEIFKYRNSFITSTSSTNVVEDIESMRKFSDNEIQNFKDEHNVILESTDIEFDIANNLDKDFFIVGKAELSDYFNYGFTNDKDYFSVRLTPYNGTYTDKWDLYFHRESFSSLYSELKSGKSDIMVVANIPRWNYEENQGNMAKVNSVNWK
ncbi:MULTISPECIES: hypothetical protein [Pontibacillus]|uniref:Lipoprotein n=1 Tax=Pontibacillus chungwhensis TaxID=265426 RepID=A0ABY8UXP8_9BACI|nr:MULTISPECIES: hypothetical protein [Pontibacillus]MCD5324159.1 hypothetical protein [Pontibacillus sp. HN14]WIF97782.1 hypothetical protein QNI29_18970 [Pontibacillus chungwhensis]